MSEQVAETLVCAGMSAAAARDKAALFRAVEAESPLSEGVERFRWFVPGRIQVLGRHTRWFAGRSLLCAAERGYCVAATPRCDNFVRIRNVVRGQSFVLQLSSNQPLAHHPAGASPAELVRRVAQHFPELRCGADISLASDLPSSTGMGNSGAWLIAIVQALRAANGMENNGHAGSSCASEDLARRLTAVENGEVDGSEIGRNDTSNGGGEKYAAILMSDAGRLKQIASSPLRIEAEAKLPNDCVFVVAATELASDEIDRTRAGLAEEHGSWEGSGSRQSSEALSSVTRVDDKPGVWPDGVPTGEEPPKRFEEFYFETESLIAQATEAIALGDLSRFCALTEASQATTDRWLGKQPAQPLWLAQQARSLGAYASTAFGGAGSVWALVGREEAHAFMQRWRKSHRESRHQTAAITQFFISEAGPATVRL